MRQAARRPPELDLDQVQLSRPGGSVVAIGLFTLSLLAGATGMASADIAPDFVVVLASFYIGLLLVDFIFAGLVVDGSDAFMSRAFWWVGTWSA
jgi:hypothetical protein